MNIFITGSSRGLGKAMALHFAQKGHRVVINGAVNKPAFEATLKQIQEISKESIGFFGDLSDYEVAKDIIDNIIKEYGELNILINNAGREYIGLFSDMKPDDWNYIINSNIQTMLNCSNIVIPYMLQKKSGHIINISSVWGEVGASCEAVYSLTKGAMNSFTKALAKELAPSNIMVNAISCGLFDTEMNNCINAEDLSDFTQKIPLNRAGKPQEIAELAYFLANSSYITAKILTIDGGLV